MKWLPLSQIFLKKIKVIHDVALNQISHSVTTVEDLVGEVAHASSEQSQGLNEINKAMSKIDEVTH